MADSEALDLPEPPSAKSKQERIQEINRLNIPQTEKMTMIRAVMLEDVVAALPPPPPDDDTCEECTESFHGDPNDSVRGCPHYMRDCYVQYPCCGKFYVCRVCHDERANHKCDRFATTTMRCMHCATVQSISGKCTNCEKVMGEYFCGSCKFFESNPDKELFHCDDCGICRVGKRDDFFHCTTCNACIAVPLKESHKCVEKSLESNCPICHVYMFESRDPVIFNQCGHAMHVECYTEYVKSSYTCPLCCKSLGDMTDYFNRIDEVMETMEMPEEFRHTVATIFCNDCERRSSTQYHFQFHKCQECGSYNSTVLSTETVESGGTDDECTSDGSEWETVSEHTIYGPEDIDNVDGMDENGPEPDSDDESNNELDEDIVAS